MEYGSATERLQRAYNAWEPPASLKEYCDIITDGREIVIRMRYADEDPEARVNMQKTLREEFAPWAETYGLIQRMRGEIMPDTDTHYTIILHPR